MAAEALVQGLFFFTNPNKPLATESWNQVVRAAKDQDIISAIHLEGETEALSCLVTWPRLTE